MMNRGYVRFWRKALDSPMWKSSVPSSLKVFLWILSEAAWKPKAVEVGRATYRVERGEVVTTLSTIACRVAPIDTAGRRRLPSRDSVWRMVRRLRDEIEVVAAEETAARTTATPVPGTAAKPVLHLKVRNYDVYQPRPEMGATCLVGTTAVAPARAPATLSKNPEECEEESRPSFDAETWEALGRLRTEVEKGRSISDGAWNGYLFRLEGFEKFRILTAVHKYVGRRLGTEKGLGYFRRIIVGLEDYEIALFEKDRERRRTLELRRGTEGFATVAEAFKRSGVPGGV